MYKTFFYWFLIFFLSASSIFSWANEDEVELPRFSKEEQEKQKPSKINQQDLYRLIDLLHLNGEKDALFVEATKRMNGQRAWPMFKHQVKNFHVEALVFYAAIGASMFRQSYMDAIRTGGGQLDPLWLETWLHEMTSPIGLFSFFAFVAVSGQTQVLFSKYITASGLTFSKGPLKGYKLRAAPLGHGVLNPRRLEDTLLVQRHKAFLDPIVTSASSFERWSSKTQYSISRSSRAVLASLGGPLGMSMGMLASNFIHELEYTFSYSVNYKNCIREVIPDDTQSEWFNEADRTLQCDLFYNEIANTIGKQGPGLVALLSASFISHALVNRGFAVWQRGSSSLFRVTSPFLNGVKVRVGSSFSKMALASKMFWLIPVPGTRILKIGGHASKFFLGLKPIKQWFIKHMIGRRFVNLYAFMEMESLLTRKLVNEWWQDSSQARSVVDRSFNFMKYWNDDFLPTESEKPRSSLLRSVFHSVTDVSEEHKYDDSIVSAHELANQFDIFRLHHLELPMMSMQQWNTHVSNVSLGLQYSKQIYQNLFDYKARMEMDKALNHPVGLFNTWEQIEQVEKIEQVYRLMISKIDDYLKIEYGVSDLEEFLSENTQDGDLAIVSSRHSYYLESMPWHRDKKALIILRQLLNSVNVDQKQDLIEIFYSEEAKSKVRDANELELKRRVMMAGMEFLNNIISMKLNNPYVSYYRNTIQNQKELEDLEQEAGEFPEDLRRVYRVLGASNIFTLLYRYTFLPLESEDEISQYRQIDFRPYLSLFAKAVNLDIENTEKAYSLNLHPNRLRMLRTNGFFDFIIASAVCGPDIDELDYDLTSIDLDDYEPLLYRSMGGTSYKIYPPRITTMSEGERSRICSGIYARPGPVVEDIYDSEFIMDNGVVYRNLAYLVLDYLDLEGVSSEQGFDQWWNEKTAPIEESLMKAFDHYYRSIVKDAYIEPLFSSSLKTGHKNNIDVDEKEVIDLHQPAMMKLVSLSKAPLQLEYSVPEGVLANLNYESVYWKKAILNFSEKELDLKTEDELKGQLLDSDDIESAESKTKEELIQQILNEIDTQLSRFINSFKPDCFDETATQEGNYQQCLSWADKFLEEQSNLFYSLGNAAALLNIDISEIDRRFQEHSYSPFKCDMSTGDSSTCQVASIEKQLGQYAFIRLFQLREVALQYMHRVKSAID